MAFFDDRRFLLSHIRNSFITGDDTGMCELVMLSDDPPPSALLQSFQSIDHGMGGELELEPFPVGVDGPTEELGQSYDIVSELELLGAHRRRSNTAQRLERLKKERRQQARVKHVIWKEPPSRLFTATEVDQFFPRKDLSEVRNKPRPSSLTTTGVLSRPPTASLPRVPSALSRQLEQFPVAPNNPFNEYARFDGRASGQKCINIFLSMLSPEERSYPLPVCPLPHAKVQDFIGLVCWQYTSEGREPKLRPSVGHYCLKIAEESGEIDEDFPSLDIKEPVSKFEFPFLALAEVERGEEEDSTGPLLTFHTKDGFSKIQISSLECTLREVLDLMLKKRKGLLRSLGPEFHVESNKDLGIPIDLDTTIRSTGIMEFILVSEDDSPCGSKMEEWQDKDSDMSAMEAHLYQAFNVSLIHRLGRSTEVQLGISGEKVEITPLLQKPKNKFWSWHPKAATHNMNEIAACEIVDRKYNSEKRLLKIVYFSGGEFKHHVFEADYGTTSDIRNKLNYILVMRTSPARLQYMAIKEKKLLRKQSSFHIPS